MDQSSSPAATLMMRPRVAVAVITATAALSIGIGILLEHLRQTRWGKRSSSNSSGGLHRRNAVRRPHGTSREDHRRTDETAAPFADENERVDVAETVVDDGGVDERWLDDMTQAVVQRAGQNIVSLLFRVSEDNARRSAYVHRGCACNACGIVPIRGIRYRCANCADFDLCETCESQGLHTKTHIFYKVKIPAPPFGPRQMQPVWYPGDPDNCAPSLPRGLMARLSHETGFERQELEAFWEQWTYMANTEWREDPDELGLAMDRRTFERCLVPSGGYRQAVPNLIHDRMFAFYDTNNDDLIGFSDRRDFLRFFRAYFVLYKQMHKDIIEGLDDQAMSTPETHQLVAGRTPLSSLFGREGRVPPADLRRVLDGKLLNRASGEVVLRDGFPPDVVSESRPDTVSRNAILEGLFARAEFFGSGDLMDDQLFASASVGNSHHHGGDDGRDTSAAANYWDALMNPPTSVQELPALLLGRRDSNLHERWVRRQFYLDEEEGATPPVDWDDGEDVIVQQQQQQQRQQDAQARNAKTQRSRSSSKVRFAEDTEDYEIQSTSSRSVPERWGGMEIPGAEKDAGQEILYQVMQQAFNELLDILFKEKEDLSVLAGQTKSAREEHRHLFEAIDVGRPAEETAATGGEEADPFLMDLLVRSGYQVLKKEEEVVKEEEGENEEKEIEEKENEEKENGEKENDRKENDENDENDRPDRPEAPADKSVTIPLLHVNGSAVGQGSEQPIGREPTCREPTYRDPTMPQFRPNSAADLEDREEEERDGLFADALAAVSTAATVATSSGGPSTPTAHGFSTLSAAATSESDSNGGSSNSSNSSRNRSGNGNGNSRNGRNGHDRNGTHSTQTPIPQATLVQWKKLDLAEQEAAQRGGWGRLSYPEFEAIFKAEEASNNRLDYLGSWIDFCIP
ncbi:ef hand domain containing protein [Grosmannia clavigera kw1407]|uniref:Ef hand domain containing protein n=1 Tax=Grosmannia clavigera (strain kw1407 / UAMH 11150) TaxID=655863 RepID=F0XDH6_GROCL|nr:ef hand domain containing protein [Grosmannia clavigera kw1407]EFX03606.1 ef hand domain containing protein [Grosmannia clavigera kw1407]